MFNTLSLRMLFVATFPRHQNPPGSCSRNVSMLKLADDCYM